MENIITKYSGSKDNSYLMLNVPGASSQAEVPEKTQVEMPGLQRKHCGKVNEVQEDRLAMEKGPLVAFSKEVPDKGTKNLIDRFENCDKSKQEVKKSAAHGGVYPAGADQDCGQHGAEEN